MRVLAGEERLVCDDCKQRFFEDEVRALGKSGTKGYCPNCGAHAWKLSWENSNTAYDLPF